jgi:chromosome segregation ATPase
VFIDQDGLKGEGSMERLEAKIDKLTEIVQQQAVHLAKIDERLGSYNQQLEIHIRRTELAEESIKQNEANIDDRLKPIEKHVAGVNTLLKAGGVIGTMIGLILSYLKLKG